MRDKKGAFEVLNPDSKARVCASRNKNDFCHFRLCIGTSTVLHGARAQDILAW